MSNGTRRADDSRVYAHSPADTITTALASTANRTWGEERIASELLVSITTGGSREITQHVDHTGHGFCRGARLGPDPGPWSNWAAGAAT
jgi:hypothetical protein